MKDFEVYSVQKPPKSTKCETQIIEFTNDDYAGVSNPHTEAEALVLTLEIANHKIRRMLIDTGSSGDILYKTTFELIKIDQGKIAPARHSVGFSGEQVIPFGFIELSVKARIYLRKKTILVKFRVIGRPSGYNAILGRTTLNELKEVTLIPHLSMKFPTYVGIGVQKGDQRIARECKNTSFKKLQKAISLGKKT
jgi:hypothetical protein